MAESNSGQEKTEEATPKRREESRKKGQVPRSRELSSAILLIMSALGMIGFGDYLLARMKNLLISSFSPQRETFFDVSLLVQHLIDAANDMLWGLMPFYVATMIASLVSPALLGGFSFSVEALQPKIEKLDPIKGLQKLFSLKGLMELVKALAKFVLILLVGIFLLWSQLDQLFSLSNLTLISALQTSAEILLWSFLILSCSLILISIVDVPFQLFQHNKELKMTKQEVRDELKQTEGQPEVKARIRRTQQEFARQRMMQEVPNADVVITNPTHFSVALKYEENSQSAPRVVAKGQDLVAMHIRDIAKQSDVYCIECASLTRAIYYSTELNHEVPAGLYLAVARVLAYVYQLRAYKPGRMKKPVLDADLPVPDELKK